MWLGHAKGLSFHVPSKRAIVALLRGQQDSSPSTAHSNSVQLSAGDMPKPQTHPVQEDGMAPAVPPCPRCCASIRGLRGSSGACSEQGCPCLAGGCIPNPCLNGGTCIEDGTHPTCLCLPGYGGSSCERRESTGPLSPWSCRHHCAQKSVWVSIFFWLVHGLGSTVLTLSSLPPCLLLWFSAEEVQPQLGQLPGSLLQALLHPEELGGRRVAVQEFWGASGHHPDPRGAGLHQRYVGPAQPAGHGTQNPSTVGLRLED